LKNIGLGKHLREIFFGIDDKLTLVGNSTVAV